jgi:hypothetical protein
VIVVDGVLYGCDDMVARFVNEHCGGGFEVGNIHAALGVLGSSGLIGGVLFSNHIAGRDITITVASITPSCGHPRILARCLAYPFNQLGLGRVTAEIDESNQRSLRNARKLGFVEEGRKRGSNVIVMGLLKNEFVFKDMMP